MLIKLVFDKQIHLYKGNIKYSELKNFCRGSFRKLPEDFHFVYFDEEGDELMMSSNLDSVNFKSLFLHNSSKAVKLIIRANFETDSNFQILEIQNQGLIDQSNQKNDSQKQGYDSIANNSFEFQPLESGSSDTSSQCQSFQIQQIQRQAQLLQLKLYKSQQKFENIGDNSKLQDLSQIYGQDFIDFQFWKQSKLEIRQMNHQKIENTLSYRFNLIQKLIESSEKSLIQEQVKNYLVGLSEMILKQQQINIESQINQIENFKQRENLKQIENNVQTSSVMKGSSQIQVIVDQLDGQYQKQQDEFNQQNLQIVVVDQQKIKQNSFKIEVATMIDQKITSLMPSIMMQVEKLIQKKINRLISQVAY